MKVLHIGNIANNAYNNAKFLRRLSVEADVLCYDYTHIMGQPEWEDAEFDGDIDEFNPQWDSVELGSFQRPSWFTQVVLDPQSERRQSFKGQFRLENYSRQTLLSTKAFKKFIDLRSEHFSPKVRFLDILKHYISFDLLRKFFYGYDLVQAYATDPIYTMMYNSGRPFIAFEHGTMREIPFEPSARGRLLAVAYKKAAKVIITNPDVRSSAIKLGLANFTFIPHPVDETKYRPKTTDHKELLRKRYGVDLIFFSPSRHNWVLKGNDLLIRAFARFKKEREVKAILIFCQWGQEVEKSRSLIEGLGIKSWVIWVPPLNKMKLIDYYNSADIVFDQFTLGTFGTVTPEAMSCGRPVVLRFDREVNEWCYGEMPPVVSAKTEEEIFGAILELTDDPQYRRAIGERSRNWVVKHHGWELVARRQLEIYNELLDRRNHLNSAME